MTQTMLMSLLMLIPIVIVVLSIVLSDPMVCWVSFIAAGFLFVFNIAGVPTYPGVYDKFLIVVGLCFNVLTVWYAWMWV